MSTSQVAMIFMTQNAGDEVTCLSPVDSGDSDMDSLFDEPCIPVHPIAIRTAPPIPGLFFPPVFLPRELEDEIATQCMHLYFEGRNVNQVMLFGRTTSDAGGDADDKDARMGKGLPPFLISLLHYLSDVLRHSIPDALYNVLFPPRGAPSRARQAIVNLYHPGEGITPHVDLLNRFDDGIIGVSLRSGCVMTFERVAGKPTCEQERCHSDMVESQTRWDLHLPERSILVLSKDARYGWTHGIPGRTHDLVESEDKEQEPRLVRRGTRLSITFRWLLPGADIVGGPDP
ncbi:hypothetical protein M404DRAFT_993426 [Pisolithus tinctorius Marx 270]|uniref:Fe2OG dioxygenase domain-containing protein n=1 Tax=Pisolithus tinctorius Marx 270 TaxID=870435 RepID=A0A0C3JTH4_PISTI|nr:hypothetical protein M404DRAFT_993426 [Pisolithus tinctorius Marx 270]